MSAEVPRIGVRRLGEQGEPGGGGRVRGPVLARGVGVVLGVGGGFTAAPPAPVTVGAPQWVAQSAFVPGTATKLALTVDDGTGALKVCSVAFTPTGTTTTLGAVLDAATTSATPAGCVSAVTPASGTGTITALNGKANSGSGTWKAGVDGSAFAGAARGTVINAGDTVALRWGS